MKQQKLLSSLKESIGIYTILTPGGSRVKFKKNVICREIKDDRKSIFISTVLFVNNIQFN